MLVFFGRSEGGGIIGWKGAVDVDESEWLKVKIKCSCWEVRDWENAFGTTALSIPISNDFDGDEMGIIKKIKGEWKVDIFFLGKMIGLVMCLCVLLGITRGIRVNKI